MLKTTVTTKGSCLGGPHMEMFVKCNLILHRYRHIQGLGSKIVGKDGSEHWGAAHYLLRGHWKPLALGLGVANSTTGRFVAVCGHPQPTWPRPCTLDSRFTTANHIQTLPFSVRRSQNQQSIPARMNRMRGRLKQGMHADKTNSSHTINTDTAGFKTVTISSGRQRNKVIKRLLVLVSHYNHETTAAEVMERNEN